MRSAAAIRQSKFAIIFLATILIAAACGGAGLNAEQTAAVAAAEENAAELQLTSDFVTTQMLDTRTGGLASLGDIVAGDRPVLLWYWAPN